MKEKELQAAVLELAAYTGWLIHHDRPARRADGSWVTHIQGDIGFPDLVLAHPLSPIVLFVELKGSEGKVAPDQRRWIEAINNGVAYERALVWRPRDWHSGEIEKILTAPRKRAVAERERERARRDKDESPPRDPSSPPSPEGSTTRKGSGSKPTKDNPTRGAK